jgi:hypothetical protein
MQPLRNGHHPERPFQTGTPECASLFVSKRLCLGDIPFGPGATVRAQNQDVAICRGSASKGFQWREMGASRFFWVLMPLAY